MSPKNKFMNALPDLNRGMGFILGVVIGFFVGLVIGPFAIIGNIISRMRDGYLRSQLHKGKNKENKTEHKKNEVKNDSWDALFSMTTNSGLLFMLGALMLPAFVLMAIGYGPVRGIQIGGNAGLKHGVVTNFPWYVAKELFTYDVDVPLWFEDSRAEKEALEIPESKQWGLSYRKIRQHSGKFVIQEREKQEEKNISSNVISFALGAKQPQSDFYNMPIDVQNIIVDYAVDRKNLTDEQRIQKILKNSFAKAEEIIDKKRSSNTLGFFSVVKEKLSKLLAISKPQNSQNGKVKVK